MRISLLALLAAVLVAVSARAAEPPGFVFVEGGAFKTTKTGFQEGNVRISSFYIGRHEVTQQEWREVMGTNPSAFSGDALPVEMVTWYDCIEYCNRRSEREGLRPAYRIDKTQPDPANDNQNDDIRWTVTRIAGANGYRLPTEAEWEYAATGGQRSSSFNYSGGDDVGKVAWFWENSGDSPLGGLWNWHAIEKNKGRTHPVGQKQPNELGIHDMSGNVREWVWDWFAEAPGTGPDPSGPARGTFRVWKGGGWVGADFCCEPSFRAHYDPNSMGHDHGFRVCRDA